MVKPRLVRHMRRPRLVRILPMHFPVVRFQRVRHMHRPRLVRTLPTHFPVVRFQRVRHMHRPRLVRTLPTHFPVVRFQRVWHMHRPRLVRTLPTHSSVVRLQRVPVKVCDLTVRPGPIQWEQPCLVLSIQMVRQRVLAAQEAREHRGVLNSRLVLLKTPY